MNKLEIRKRIRQQRSALSAQHIKELSQKIVNRLVDYTNWGAVENLHTYVTIPKLNEVDTKPFIELIKQTHPSIKLYHPEDEPDEVDLVIVPLVAFDENGNRIGHGGGYYDRFLKKYPRAKKIGLAYELQKIDEVPAEPHDVPLDAVITEAQVYQF